MLVNYHEVKSHEELRVNCVCCNKSFKRERDLMSHIKIMHKDLTEKQKLDQEAEIKILYTKMAKQKQLKSTNTQSDKKVFVLPSSIVKLSENKKIKLCFVCNKIFRDANTVIGSNLNSVITTNINKSFIRFRCLLNRSISN